MARTDVLIIGGGPSGLGLATGLRERQGCRVTVVEREEEGGGIPRHCGHYPFGLREMRRLMKGPDYARALVERALASGVELRLQATALGRKENSVSLSTPQGLEEVEADTIVLATGVRESSRAQRNIGGIKTSGVISTGALQGLVYLEQMQPFKNPIILGSELVSFSAIQTCRHLGIKPRAMVDLSPSPKARQIFTFYPKLLLIPCYYNVSDFEILGERKVESVRFRDDANRICELECDGVIISGDFRPESSLAREFGLEIDTHTGGPSVDQFARTSVDHIFAIGNGLRAVETAGWCWQESQNLAQSLGNVEKNSPSKPITIASSQIRYAMPSKLALSSQSPVFNALQIRLEVPAKGELLLKCGAKTIARKRINSGPERRILLPLDEKVVQNCLQNDEALSLHLEGD